MREILDSEAGSVRGDDDFFSVASTIPFVAVLRQRGRGTCDSSSDRPLIPSAVTPWLTAFKAYSKGGVLVTHVWQLA